MQKRKKKKGFSYFSQIYIVLVSQNMTVMSLSNNKLHGSATRTLIRCWIGTRKQGARNRGKCTVACCIHRSDDFCHDERPHFDREDVSNIPFILFHLEKKLECIDNRFHHRTESDSIPGASRGFFPLYKKKCNLSLIFPFKGALHLICHYRDNFCLSEREREERH